MYLPPDRPGVYIHYGTKRRCAQWQQTTDTEEYEKRVMRLAAELISFSPTAGNLLMTFMISPDFREKEVIERIVASFATLGNQASENGYYSRLVIYPNQQSGWKLLKKLFTPKKRGKV